MSLEQRTKSNTYAVLSSNLYLHCFLTINTHKQTMYATGRTAQVARDFQRYRLDILGLADVRGELGESHTRNWGTLLFSGQSGDSTQHRNGVGLTITKKSLGSLL